MKVQQRGLVSDLRHTHTASMCGLGTIWAELQAAPLPSVITFRRGGHQSLILYTAYSPTFSPLNRISYSFLNIAACAFSQPLVSYH